MMNNVFPGRTFRLCIQGKRIEVTHEEAQRILPGWAIHFEAPSEDELDRIMRTPPTAAERGK